MQVACAQVEPLRDPSPSPCSEVSLCSSDEGDEGSRWEEREASPAGAFAAAVDVEDVEGEDSDSSSSEEPPAPLAATKPKEAAAPAQMPDDNSISLRKDAFQAAIHAKLRALLGGDHADAKMLAEFIVVMVASNKGYDEMYADLRPLFESQDDARKFVTWVLVTKPQFVITPTEVSSGTPQKAKLGDEDIEASSAISRPATPSLEANFNARMAFLRGEMQKRSAELKELGRKQAALKRARTSKSRNLTWTSPACEANLVARAEVFQRELRQISNELMKLAKLKKELSL